MPGPDLRRHQACRGLTEAIAQAAGELSRAGRRRKLKAGEQLYGEGGSTESAFLLTSGRLRTLGRGRIESYGPGELVGELCFCAVRARQETAVATQACEVIELSATQLLRALRNSEALAKGLLEWYCERLGEARALAGEAQLASAAARVARRVLELAAAEGIVDGEARVLVRRPTHAELGRGALVSRERVSAVLADLRSRGLVAYGRTGPLRVLLDKLRAELPRL